MNYKNVSNKIDSNKVTNISLKKKIFKKLSQVRLSLLSATLGSASAPAGAIDATETAKDII